MNSINSFPLISTRTSGKLTRLLVSFLLVMTSIAAPFTQSARADVTKFNERSELSMTVTNECTGETIALEGSLHTSLTLVADGSGNLHISSHSNWQHMRGTGLSSGDKYVGIETTSTHSSGVFDPNAVTTAVSTIRLIGQGNAPDMRLHVIYHYTIVDGRITASIDSTTLDCR